MNIIEKYLEGKEKKEVEILELSSVLNPFRFMKFGDKIFEKINIQYRVGEEQKTDSIVIKKYNGIDMTMIMSEDYSYREIEFANSDLAKEFKGYFDIPVFYGDESNKKLYMEDRSENMASFGPPNMPTEEQMKSIIGAVAKKDALLNKGDYPFVKTYDQSFNSMGTILLGLIDGALDDNTLQKLKESWSWFYEGVEELKKQGSLDIIDKLRKVYQNKENIMEEVKGLPFSYQHGDFYFGNIGLTNDLVPVVIDWESITYGPIGLDYLQLTQGMPELSFSNNMAEWYVDSYNEYSDKNISIDSFKRGLETISKHLFFTSGIIEALRFGFTSNPNIPQPVKDGIKEDFFSRL